MRYMASARMRTRRSRPLAWLGSLWVMPSPICCTPRVLADFNRFPKRGASRPFPIFVSLHTKTPHDNLFPSIQIGSNDRSGGMPVSNPQASRVSRRGFMKAAGLGAAGTALGAVTVTSAQAQEEWDEQFDVVVAGSGGAAFAGAIGALHGGVSVVMLEKAPFIGGTTAKSGGGSW